MLFVRITQIFRKYNVGIVEFRKLSCSYNYEIKNPLELAMQTSPKGNLHRLTTGVVIYSPFASSCTNAQNTTKIGRFACARHAAWDN